MTKFNLKDVITNFNGDDWKVIFITNRSYKIQLVHEYLKYRYESNIRILDIDYVEKNFIKRNGNDKFDKYANVIKKDLICMK